MPRISTPLSRAFHRSLAPGAVSRRGFLSAVGLAAVAVPVLGACSGRKRKADIAIVGAGLAGLACAHRLRQAGLEATVFEAQGRVGGRVWSARDPVTGQIFELGGELIDTNHVVMRGLCAELGLDLVDLAKVDEAVSAQDFWFGQRRLTQADLVDAWRPVASRIAADLALLEREAALPRFDALSVADYLAGLPGLEPLMRDVLDVAYTAEFGLETDQQSALNLLWLIGDDPDVVALYGESDERFRLADGNDRLPSGLAARVASQIEVGHRLVAVRTLADGRHTLVFEVDGRTVEQTFSRVVLTLPWTVLREVRFSPELPELKRRQVDELGYGRNSKLMLGFSSRPWRTRHQSAGSAFFGAGPQSTWETSRGQAGDAGILTVFAGGRAGDGLGIGDAEARGREVLPNLEAIYPGVAEVYRPDSAVRMHWPTFPWSRGSYSCFKPGQAAWAESVGEPVGNLHFAGEHISVEFQGFMEGAVETGVKVAAALVAQRS